MKKILLFAAALCGLTSFAVDPVAVWNGDFDTTEKTGTDTKTYTLAANGNSVAADGSTITISAEKGVSVSWPTGRGAQTTIVKVSGLKNDTTNVQTLFTVGNGSSARVGVTLNTDGTTKGIWGGNLWYDASLCQQQGTLEIPSTGSMYMAVANAYNGGTHLYEKTADSWTRIYQANGLQSSGDSALFKTVSIGGSVVANSDYVVAEGMMIEAIAVFDQQLSQDQIAAYEFPQKLPGVISLNICNGLTADAGAVLVETETMAGTIPANAWQNICDTTTSNLRQGTKTGVTAWTCSQSTTLSDVSVSWSCNNNDMANLYKDVTTTIPFLKCYYSRANQSGLNGPVTFTITGIPYSSYDVIVYLSGNSAEKNPNQAIRVNDSLYYGGTVDAEHKYGTYAGSSASWGTVANQSSVEYGKNVIRVEGQTSSTAVIKLDSQIEKWGIAAIQIVEMSAETEEPEETETTNYNFNKFLTDSYQDTGWSVTLEEIFEYGLFAGTMDGNYVSGSNVPAQGFYKKTGTDGSVSVVEFQMQIYQEGSSASDKYLKATRVYAKEQGGTIWLRAVSSGNVQYGTLGTEVTSWNGTLAKAADQAGYGVASVALSITKPVDKSVKGSIDEVATAHSEDYTSNTITAKVMIENEGEYKGEAVLVYALGETQYVSEIEKGSASITIFGLEGGEVYRGTLALGQKIGEDVTVIEGTEQPVALYQGEQKFVWIASPFVIQEKTLVNDAQGLTIENPFADPDYIDLCDSEFTVSISASEAVDAENDAALDGTEQGGVRIAEVDGGLKLQVVVDGAWTDFANAAVDTTYTLKVKFHYEKSQEGETDATSVTYALDSTSKTSTNPTGKLKVTEIFVSDGTNLAKDLFGACQLDKAVVVDVEIEPGDEVVGIEADNDEEAQKIAAKLKVGISEAVAAVLTTAEQQEAYRAYFKIIAVKAEDGSYTAQVAFADGVESDIEKDIAEAIDDVVESFNTGAAVKIAAKPGLYYGVKRGDSLESMTVDQDSLTLATGSTVNVTITKPEGASAHFYRIIVSPTPATK